MSGLTEKRKKGLGVIRPELFKRPREAQLGISGRLGLRLAGRPDRVAPEKGWLGSRLRAGSILARAMVKRAGSGPFQQRLPSYFPSPSLQLTRQPHGAAVPPSLPTNGSRGSVTPRIRRGRAPSRAAHPVRGRLCGRSPERRQRRLWCGEARRRRLGSQGGIGGEEQTCWPSTSKGSAWAWSCGNTMC